MKTRKIPVVALIALLFASPALMAGPPDKENGQGHGKHAKHGKAHGKEARFERGAPPPWAPAYGYRRGEQSAAAATVTASATQVAVASPYNAEFEARAQADSARISADVGISKGTCNRDKIGTVLGAVAGGVIANRTASEENRTAATIAGAVIGGIVGNTIGKTMDNRDVQCTGQALERVGDNQTIAWKNTTNAQEYQITPMRTYSNEQGLYCREYTSSTSGSTSAKSIQNACRYPDGSWRMMQ